MNKNEHKNNLTLTLLEKIKELENNLKELESEAKTFDSFQKWLALEYIDKCKKYDAAEERKDEKSKSFYSAQVTEAYLIYSKLRELQ